jgi:hypothetical protein
MYFVLLMQIKSYAYINHVLERLIRERTTFHQFSLELKAVVRLHSKLVSLITVTLCV